MIDYGKHYIDEDDLKSVEDVLCSDFLTTGPLINEFEIALQKFTGYDWCTVMSSGTAALHSAMFAIDVREEDEIIIPSITFVATANCIKMQGGKVVIADVEEDTILIDCDKIESLINKNTKAIIAVDYAGQQCNYRRLRDICNKHNIYLISDACHSLGRVRANLENQIADITCYSFHPVKTITTGEGGACLTNDWALNEKIKLFINHGRINGNCCHLGYNYRMSDIHASLGISQLKKYNIFQLKRAEISDLYYNALNNDNIKLLKRNNNNSYHLFAIKVNDRHDFMTYMFFHGINCVIHYPAIYDNDLYKYVEHKHCKTTEKIKNHIVSIPIHYRLTYNEVLKIINVINKYFEHKGGK